MFVSNMLLIPLLLAIAPCQTENHFTDELKKAREHYKKYMEQPYLATFHLSKSSFRLGALTLSMSLDSLRTRYDRLYFESNYEGANGECVIELSQEGMFFTGNGKKLVVVSSVRPDVTNPEGLRCGLSVEDLKKIFRNIDLNSESSGLINVIPDEEIQSQYFDLVITRGHIEMIVLRRSDT